MNKRALALAAALPVAALLLSACGSSTTAGSSSSSDMSMPAHSSSDAMMHNAADVSFASEMIPHHQQAVDMAKLAATRSSNSQVKDLAARIEAAQGPEITTMSGWLKGWGQPMPENMAGMDMPGLMSTADMDALAKATRGAFDKAFLTMMIAHHTGALTMAKTELAKGSDAEAKALAQAVVDGQTKEITEMKALLASS